MRVGASCALLVACGMLSSLRAAGLCCARGTDALRDGDGWINLRYARGLELRIYIAGRAAAATAWDVLHARLLLISHGCCCCMGCGCWLLRVKKIINSEIFFLIRGFVNSDL